MSTRSPLESAINSAIPLHSDPVTSAGALRGSVVAVVMGRVSPMLRGRVVVGGYLLRRAASASAHPYAAEAERCMPGYQVPERIDVWHENVSVCEVSVAVHLIGTRPSDSGWSAVHVVSVIVVCLLCCGVAGWLVAWLLAD